MKTQKINTRFMEANKDVEGYIFDLLASEIGIKATLDLSVDLDAALYSNGFIGAIEEGLIPDFTTISDCSSMKKCEKEYHHVILDGECFIVYFN